MRFPSFTGQLILDDQGLAPFAEDFGHKVKKKPLGVLRPGSVGDVITAIAFARQHGIAVAARGQGHTTQGQCQVEAGLCIDMGALDRIHEIDHHSARVDAGVRWLTLVQKAVASGLTPPALTDYIDLSVGGTLSVGGIGGASFRTGTQADNVLELEVVTGCGELITCSPRKNAELFDACRGGLGQFGLITKAKVRLVAAPSHVRAYTLPYSELASFLADQQMLIADGRFDYLLGSLIPGAPGRWAFSLEAVKYCHTGESAARSSDEEMLLDGLSCVRRQVQVLEHPYFDFANRLAAMAEALKASGSWAKAHPWMDLFIPATSAETLLTLATTLLSAEDIGDGYVMTYPLHRQAIQAPFLSLPDERQLYLFDILPALPQNGSERLAAFLVRCGRIYEEARRLGATVYPIGYPVGTRAMGWEDWRTQLGQNWSRFLTAKQHFDPDGILTPGPAVFPKRSP